MKTIEDMKLELLSDNSNKFMQTLIDYDIKSKDKYGSNLLHYYIMYLQPIITQYFIGNKSEIWSLSLIVHSKG